MSFGSSNDSLINFNMLLPLNNQKGLNFCFNNLSY